MATGFRVRLLGLSFLDCEEVGSGLLIPHCSSVHTVGMRFPLDLYFLDELGAALVIHRAVPPLRTVIVRDASAVLEVPSPAGGEFSLAET
jgi:uncharacterized membrane protein (UPF0127 family)